MKERDRERGGGDVSTKPGRNHHWWWPHGFYTLNQVNRTQQFKLECRSSVHVLCFSTSVQDPQANPRSFFFTSVSLILPQSRLQVKPPPFPTFVQNVTSPQTFSCLAVPAFHKETCFSTLTKWDLTTSPAKRVSTVGN